VIGRKRSTFGQLGAGLALGAALILAGCGGTALDSESLEAEVSEYLHKSLHEDVKSIDCPSEEPVDPGRIVDCTVTLKGGQKKVIGIEIVNKDADIRVAHYRGANE